MFHDVTGYTLNKCRTFSFLNKPLNIRKKFFSEKRTYASGVDSNHVVKTCSEKMKRMVCERDNHPTTLHVHGGEAHTSDYSNNPINEDKITYVCTKLCGNDTSIGKSCAKVVLVTIYPKDRPNKRTTMYAPIDHQNNRSLAKPEFFEALEEQYTEVEYVLSYCDGVMKTLGCRFAPESFIFSNLGETSSFILPALIGCFQIPNVGEEIPTPSGPRHDTP